MKYSRQFALVLLTVTALVCLNACNSTEVNGSWVAPDVSKISFKKIVVVAATPDSGARRMVEDGIKARITGVECIPSHTLISAAADLHDIDKVHAALKAAGADGVIVLRPISSRHEVTVIPGEVYPVPYRTFSGYYCPAYGLSAYYQEPDEIRTDRIMQMETNIYEVAGGRLIWSATTTSTNSKDIEQFITDIFNALHKELMQQRLIARP
jgi:hypothetical protein